MSQPQFHLPYLIVEKNISNLSIGVKDCEYNYKVVKLPLIQHFILLA